MNMEPLWISGLVGLVVLLVLVTVQFMRRQQLQQQQIDALQNHLNMFAEASINVARSVDCLNGAVDRGAGARVQTARTALVQTVCERSAKGGDVAQLVQDYRLSRDEARLLNLIGQRGGASEGGVQASM